MSEYLFTYGTLMSGFNNPFAECLRRDSTWLGSGYFTGKLYRIEWYPGAVYAEQGANRVIGEVYKISMPGIWKELDAYEDVFEDENSSLYVRRQIPVRLEEREIVCWAYLYNQSLEGLECIEDGDFRGFLKRTS